MLLLQTNKKPLSAIYLTYEEYKLPKEIVWFDNPFNCLYFMSIAFSKIFLFVQTADVGLRHDKHRISLQIKLFIVSKYN